MSGLWYQTGYQSDNPYQAFQNNQWNPFDPRTNNFNWTLQDNLPSWLAKDVINQFGLNIDTNNIQKINQALEAMPIGNNATKVPSVTTNTTASTSTGSTNTSLGTPMSVVGNGLTTQDYDNYYANMAAANTARRNANSFWGNMSGWDKLTNTLGLLGGIASGIGGIVDANRAYHLQRDNFNLNKDKFEEDKKRYWQKWDRQNEARNDAML